MNLVEKENYIAAARRLVDDLFKTLLELSAILRTCDDSGHIERHNALRLHLLWNFAAVNRLRETFHDGGLADAGLADQDGVVFGSAR